MSQADHYESAVEKAIREAQERGQFDNLPHSGKPLPGLDGPDDELWWVRNYVRREGLSGEEFLPESLLLRGRPADVAIHPARLELGRARRVLR